MPETETATFASNGPEIRPPIPVKYDKPRADESLRLETGTEDGIDTCKTFASGAEPIVISEEAPSINRTRSFLPAQDSKSKFETVTVLTLKNPAEESSGVGAPCHSSPSAT